MAEQPDPSTTPTPPPAQAAPGPDYRDLYLRALAELDNYRKRSEKDRAAILQAAPEAVLRRLLEPFDSLDRALVDLARLKGDLPATVQPAFARSLEGLRALQRQFEEVMEAEGLERVKAQGLPFDPSVHEALARLEHPTAPAGAVLEVLRPGYTRQGRLIRAAAVVVSAGPSAAAGDHGSGSAAESAATPAHRGAPASGAPEKTND